MERAKKIDSCLRLKKNLEAVFNSVHDGIISLNNDLKIVSMNEAAERFFGRKKGHVIGKYCFCNEMLADIKDLLLETVKKQEPIKDYSMKFTDYAGDEKTIILSTSILYDENEKQGGVVAILHDISARQRLQQILKSQYAYHRLIGKSKQMIEMYTMIDKVADSNAAVLLEGESGVGKGLVAEAIHKKSKRKDAPFVKVNCAALSENLLESELFGHVKGAFTGAMKDRIGRFELARGGTIFLDEIGEISHATQVKLLTVLQDKTIEAVGDTKQRKVDIRVITATNRSLAEMVKEGSFREDLYYRVKVVRMRILPLRERVDDIPPLANHFIERQLAITEKPISGITDMAMKLLVKHRWPGNVRELENAIAQAFVLCDEGPILPEHLPEEITEKPLMAYKNHHDSPAIYLETSDEREKIAEALRQTGGQKTKAAKILGIDRTTLWRKMKEMQI